MPEDRETEGTRRRAVRLDHIADACAPLDEIADGKGAPLRKRTGVGRRRDEVHPFIPEAHAGRSSDQPGRPTVLDVCVNRAVERSRQGGAVADRRNRRGLENHAAVPEIPLTNHRGVVERPLRVTHPLSIGSPTKRPAPIAPSRPLTDPRAPGAEHVVLSTEDVLVQAARWKGETSCWKSRCGVALKSG